MQEKTLQNPKIRTSNIHSSEFGSVSYDIFGSPYQKTGSFLANDSLDFGYLGKPYNDDTELYDYGFRDYSPEIAHFTSVDPIRDGRNWFSYVVNDPVNYVDLWGLCGSDESKKLVLKMGGRKLTNFELFDYLVDVVEGTEIMGKAYSTDRIRDDRDFATWFNSSSEGKLYYKKLEADIWEE